MRMLSLSTSTLLTKAPILFGSNIAEHLSTPLRAAYGFGGGMDHFTITSLSRLSLSLALFAWPALPVGSTGRNGCAMANHRRPEVRDADLRGLKYFKILDPLLDRLHKEATQRDKAKNRKLFFDGRAQEPAVPAAQRRARDRR